jgi:hypothetical protein
MTVNYSTNVTGSPFYMQHVLLKLTLKCLIYTHSAFLNLIKSFCTLHYMFRHTLVIIKCLKLLVKTAALPFYGSNIRSVVPSACSCILWCWVSFLVVLCVLNRKRDPGSLRRSSVTSNAVKNGCSESESYLIRGLLQKSWQHKFSEISKAPTGISKFAAERQQRLISNDAAR